MKETQDYQETAIKNATHILLSKYPEAVGVVYWILDCGCIKMCCASEKGDPIGGTLLTSGQPMPDRGTMFVCHKCVVDRISASERTVDQGIVWTRVLGNKHRKAISAKVFGPGSEAIGQAIIYLFLRNRWRLCNTPQRIRPPCEVATSLAETQGLNYRAAVVGAFLFFNTF